MNRRSLKDRGLCFLCLAPNKFPPRHVDVSVLFGEELANRGHRIDFLLQSKDSCNAFYQTTWNGIRVFVGATNLGNRIHHRFTKRLLDLLNNLKVFKLTRHNQYDFVQVKDRFVSALVALVAARLTKTKYFYWLSYPFPEANLYQVRSGTARYPMIYFVRGFLLKLLLYRVILPLSDHVFVQSEEMKRAVSAKGIPAWEITPVPMGVSLASTPHSPAVDGRVGDKNRGHKDIVYLGSLIRTRKLDFLLKVFHAVLQQEPDARLYMIGAGEDPRDIKFLKGLGEELGVGDRVTFTGFLPMREAWSYVENAALGVSPYYPSPILRSTSPTKLVEYMAMGKPVVANDHPEQSRVILESGAGLCVPYDIDAFSHAIVELLRDPERAFRMGQRGRKYVEQHRSYEKIADSLEQTYCRLLKFS
jgi:glycosyltransferase involved in cell wall biosynthesis